MRCCLAFFTRFCVLACWLLFSHSVAAQVPEWQQTKLDAAATIQFPGAAIASTVKGQQAFYYKDEQSIFLVVVQQQAFRADASDTDAAAFLKGTLEGTLEAAGGGKVEQQRPVTVAGFPGLEAQFTMPIRPELPAIKFMRVVLVNGTAYTLNYWTSVEHGQTELAAAERNRFFTSLEPGVTRAIPAASDSGQSGAYKAGNMIGRIGFYVLLGAGLLLFVRHLHKPKTQ